MGLLDFTNTDGGMQALGLLAAAGPSMEPMNFASRLAQAGGTYQALQRNKATLDTAMLNNLVNAYGLRRLQNWDAEVMGGGNGGGGGVTAPQFQPGDIRSPGAFITPPDGMGPTLPVSDAPAAMTQAPAGQWQYGLRGVSDQISRMAASSMKPDEYMKLLATQNAPQTDIEKLMAAQGIDRNSPMGQTLLGQAIKKTNYIAPVNARPGSILRDPSDPSQVVAFNPHIPEGSTPVFDSQGNVVAFRKIGNADEALGVAPAAVQRGKNTQTPTVAYGPDGKPRYSTAAQDVERANGATPPPQAVTAGQFTGDPAEAITRISAIPDPRERANAMTALLAQVRAQGSNLQQTQPLPDMRQPQPAGGGGAVTPVLAPGVEKGATLSQDELSKKWADLTATNREAQNTASYLDNIKQLASRAAVGPLSDKLQFTNGLLGAVGGSERAMDATTANNLLDKYSNQIVARLSSGGMSTDAARSILQAAYPNAHMTADAIAEAADNIKGAMTQQQAKARFLQQAANARDPAAYSQREVLFDQAADPRIFQLAGMSKAAGDAFLSKLPPSVLADLKRRKAILQQAGAL